MRILILLFLTLLSIIPSLLRNCHVLVKIKDRPSQHGLDREERAENVKDSFQIKAGVICPKNLLLVDDIWMSGATIKECSEALTRSGAENVWAFTLARTD